MRTSRVSRETARVINALSPLSNPLSTSRRSLRRSQHTNVADGSIEAERLSTSTANHQDSNDASKATRASKRKRDASQRHGDSVTGLGAEESTTSSRPPPRKVTKLEPEANSANGIRKARRQPAKHIKGSNGQIKVEPPPNWETLYDITAQMRKRVLAPVDTMGCESLADVSRPPQDQRLQTLIALMLSSQTKDTVTAVAIRNLQEGLPGGFCLDSLLKAQPDELNRLIEKVGFHNNKTKFIKQTAEILRDKFGSDIPDTIEGLVSLPGVGPKMAYLCMSAAWGRDEGIGVDVHVHRITNLWAWHKTSTPEQTRAELEAWLPREKWHDINHLLVGFGQTTCLPVGRKCGECDLAAKKLCPSAVASKPVKKRTKKEVQVKIEDADIVKNENILIEEDDVGIKIEAETLAMGAVEIQSSHPADLREDTITTKLKTPAAGMVSQAGSID